MRKIFVLSITLLLALTGNLFAQARTISGTVTSADDGSPLPGVTVLVYGTADIGTVTDIDGRYAISVPEGFEALEFSFVGMETQTIQIGTTNVINVELEATTELIDELVVTALGIEREARTVGFAQEKLGETELSAAREISVANFLTGRMAGVRVSKTGGGTGGSSSISIRGFSSISGDNQPLYVVDGVPITNLNMDSGGWWNEKDYGDGIGSLNSEDIESMTVLKGPNASALYGARGSNGVILITTKSGARREGVGVEFNSNFSADYINLVPTFQNKYATGYEETNLYGSMVEIPEGSGNLYETMPPWHGDHWGPPLDERRIIADPFLLPGEEPRTLALSAQPADNMRDFYETGFTHNNTIAITGGSETTNARLSLGNMSATGIMPGHKISRQTVNLRAFNQASDILSFDAKINYIREKGNQRPYNGVAINYNITRQLQTMGRYVPMDFLKEYYETTGEYGNWPGVLYNPYYMINELKDNDNRDRIIGQLTTTLKLTEGLSLMGRLGSDFYTEKRHERFPMGARGRENFNGRIINSDRFVQDLNADLILTGNSNISPALNINGSLGASYLNQTRDFTTNEGRNFKAPGVYHISNVEDILPWDYFSEKEMQSVFFTGQVGYQNFLFLDVTGRNDWSSTLGRDNYSFFYPSVGTSLIFTEAFDFIPENILPFGKLRASWAQVGNDSGPYLTRAGYNLQTQTFAGQSRANMPSRIPLFDLKNELTESWEVGLDLRFIQNRVGLDITYYDAKTTNQILPVEISNASGYGTVLINAGEISNKGLEAMLNLSPIRTADGFNWTINANYSRNISEVVELAPGVETYTLDNVGRPIEARPGEPYGSIIGYKYKRAPDGRKIVSDGGQYLREETQSILGNIMPDWIGGVNNNLSYRGLSLSFLIDFVQGRELYSNSMYQMTAKGSGVWTTEGRRERDIDDDGNQLPYVGVLDGVNEILNDDGEVVGYEENTIAVNGQSYWATRAWGAIHEEFVVDGSYIMLREVMISYRFDPSLLNNLRIQGLTLSLVGRNLFFIEEHMRGMGISPETAPNTSAGASGGEAHSHPTTRTFGLNLKVNF